MGLMLSINSDNLPQSSLTYAAFRIACRETTEHLALAHQMGDCPFDCVGYLHEVPFFRTVPPHVQLDLLAATWAKHIADQKWDASLVDEAIIYAVCETAATVVEQEPGEAKRYLQGGPYEIDYHFDHWLASQFRALHLNLSNEGDFLMISQFEDMQPDEARWLKRKFRLDLDKLEEMFDVLGRWKLSSMFRNNLKELLTDREINFASSLVKIPIFDT